MKYEARLYCLSTEGHFYASSEGYTFTAMDNGGKIIKSVLSYSKRIDVVNDNAVVNTVLCEMA
jgi:hypothetical protein